MGPLLIAIAGLVVGPLLASLMPSNRTWRLAMGGLSLTLVGGLCLLHLAPHALEHGGGVALLAGLIGLALPWLADRAGGQRARIWYALAMVLLAIHAATDGALLALANGDLGSTMALAVAAHRLPVGLAVFDTSRERPSIGWLAIGVLCLATVAGFGLGASIADALPDTIHGAFEGLIAGALLHTVVMQHDHGHDHGTACDDKACAPHDHDHHHDHGHHDHDHDHHHHDHQRPDVAEPIGALTGLAILAVFTASAGGEALHHVEETAQTFVSLTLDSAPALVVGFVAAGLLSSFLDASSAGWLTGGGRMGSALRGVGFGLPLPVCSCGVVPMYTSLIRKGVPTAAALAFLVATPELGLDAVLLSVPLLGVPMTIARVVAAFLAALLTAVLVGRAVAASPPVAQRAPAPERTFRERLDAGLRYGFVDLVDHTLPWILAGLVVASLAEPLFDHDVLVGLPAVVQVPVAALVGIPVYVCASGATPLAAIAVHKGLSGGAAIAFLIAGPATNVTTFGVLAGLHGRALAFRFGVVLVVLAVLMGWGVDLLGIGAPELLHAPGSPAESPRPIAWAATAGLTLLGLASLFRQGMQGIVGQITHPIHVHRPTG